LSAANNYLNTVMAAYASDQSTPLDRTLLQIETQHWLAQQAMRGLYPDAPVTTIGEFLRTQQDELLQQGSPLRPPDCLRCAGDATWLSDSASAVTRFTWPAAQYDNVSPNVPTTVE
jgi:hypothetical protein